MNVKPNHEESVRLACARPGNRTSTSALILTNVRKDKSILRILVIRHRALTVVICGRRVETPVLDRRSSLDTLRNQAFQPRTECRRIATILLGDIEITFGVLLQPVGNPVLVVQGDHLPHPRIERTDSRTTDRLILNGIYHGHPVNGVTQNLLLELCKHGVILLRAKPEG